MGTADVVPALRNTTHGEAVKVLKLVLMCVGGSMVGYGLRYAPGADGFIGMAGFLAVITATCFLPSSERGS